MRFLSSVAPVALLASVAAAKAIPGSYIVEFENEDENADNFMSTLAQNNVPASLRMSLHHGPTFHGVSFNLHDDTAETLESIQSMGAVKKVWPVHLYSHTSMRREHFEAFDRRAIQQKRDEVDTYSTHVMGNVDKLHDEGHFGTGITIGIVDTGVDYTHPSLGGGFGPGYKVAMGYDLVGDAYDGSNVPVPDDDPIDCDGHGTHVAGIIGANDAMFTGVASNATLGIWKVFGCPGGEAGSAGDDVLIAAFSMAAAAGVDIISSSIGGPPAYSEDAWAIAITRIVDSGIPCILAAGNDGSEGVMYGSSAASAPGVIAVGSVDNTLSPEILTEATYTTSTDATAASFGYTPATGAFNNSVLPLYILTLDTTVVDDGCDAFPASTPDLSGYIVLIRRGTCTFDTKITNAMAAGAQNVLIYNNVPGTIDASVTVDANVGMVPPETGATWIADALAGQDITIAFNSDGETVITSVANDVTGGSMSSFSTWYPTNELDLRPHVSAPGGNILSTYFQQKAKYAVLSGTSMATPYIAGVVALIQEVKGKSTSPDVIRTLLATTSNPVQWNEGGVYYEFLTPTALQGGGLVDAYAAIYGTLSVDTDLIALNDTEFHVNTKTLTFTNEGNETAEYYLHNVPAPVAYTFDANTTTVTLTAPEYVQAAASVSFSEDILMLGPGESQSVDVTINAPEGLDATRLPVYSGYIGVTGSTSANASDILSVPYMGVASVVNDFNVTDFADGFPALLSSVSNATDATFFATPEEGPIVAYRLSLPSPLIRIDVQSVSDPSLNTIAVFPDAVTGTNDSTTAIYGSLLGFPLPINQRDISGNFSSYAWNWTITTGTYDNGTAAVTTVPVGATYRIIYRALKMFGDVSEESDYEVWTSEDFTIGSKPSRYLVY